MGDWLGLIVGNSKLHWGQFTSDRARDSGICHPGKSRLLKTWDSPHRSNPLYQLEPKFHGNTPLYFASVVPEQGELIAAYGWAREITLDDIPLGNLYSTLGIDRALALLGAGDRYGYPVLVIDGGTAITLTGADGDRDLVGGAILPGLQLQFDSLGLGTAALPQLSAGSAGSTIGQADLPDRWARNTEEAITSGILHNLASGVLAFVMDWLERYPRSAVVTTGGSGPWLAARLAAIPQVREPEPNLGLYGLWAWQRQFLAPEL